VEDAELVEARAATAKAERRRLAPEEEAEAGLMDSQLSLGELDGLEVSTSEARLRIDCVSVQNPGLDPRAFIDMCTRFDWHAST
jgi:hypothetical protein